MPAAEQLLLTELPHRPPERLVDSPLAGSLRRYRYIVPSFLVALIVCAWFVTWGDWKFFEPEDFCSFYDAQARSLIEGRLDVPAAAIGSEAFTFQGKTYGYFGIGPALLRIPLVIASPKLDGLWSR